MELTEEQILFIRSEIHKKGITMATLADSVVDHICCVIENGCEPDFHKAYEKALGTFANGELESLQQKTILLLNLKKQIIMKKAMYILGFIAAFLISSGLLFKIQHWPGAAVMLTLAIVLLNFGFLPLFFYDRYKRSLG